MSTFNYKYREHTSNGKVFHGMIALKSEIVKEGGRTVNVKCDIPYEYGGKYVNSIVCGANYFADKFFNENGDNLGLNIKIMDIGAYPIDTTWAVMMYVTIMALVKQYEISMDGFSFNKESGELILT
jgi:hypothetical protein